MVFKAENHKKRNSKGYGSSISVRTGKSAFMSSHNVFST